MATDETSQEYYEDDITKDYVTSLLPEHVLEQIFQFLALADLKACSLVCRAWYNFLSDEDNWVWKQNCLQRLPEETWKSELLQSCPTYKTKLRAYYHAWNPNDCSRNVYIKATGFTMHRNPIAQSTDAVRAKIGFRTGRHAWEVSWEGPLGTVAIIGVATKDASLQNHGYVASLDDSSWGWNLVDNQLLHDGETKGNFPLLNNPPKYEIGEIITVILDCEDHTLSFEKGSLFLGVAFKGN
jgi:F-box protein 45